ncbi:MAG: hypothetical protein PHV39_04265 [Methanomicrobium sp.]|nr:hypothetical protein [Methanomicrobium sp.]
MTAEKLNRKDITAEVTGLDFDFDSIDAEEVTAEQKDGQPIEDQDNAIVDILDMLIGSSGDMLKEYGYPEPKLEIWVKWGKPNLTKALNEYMPAAATNETISSPAVCGLIGIGALALCFMPVIMQFVSNQKQQQIAEPEQERQEPEEQTGTEKPATYQEENPTTPSSTAPISEHTLSALERLERAG